MGCDMRSSELSPAMKSWVLAQMAVGKTEAEAVQAINESGLFPTQSLFAVRVQPVREHVEYGPSVMETRWGATSETIICNDGGMLCLRH